MENPEGQSICAVISLGDVSPHRSVQPTRGWPFPQEGKAHAETSSLPSSTDDFAPAWPCSRRGLPGHLHYGKRRWSLTPPFHHHRLTPRGGSGCLFLWPFSGRFAPFGGSPPRLLSDAVLYGVRTFLDPDNAEPRLPDQPEAIA